MATLTQSALKDKFIDGVSEIIMSTVAATNIAVDNLYGVANKAKRNVMDKATNFLLTTTGAESGLFSIMVATAEQAIEMGNEYAHSKTLAPERRQAIAKAVGKAEEAKAHAKVNYDLVPLSDDSEDNWTPAVQGEATEAIKALLNIRKDYIIRIHELYVKTKSEETEAIIRKIGTINENFCNEVAAAFASIQKELEADGIDIGSMINAVTETAASIKGADIDTKGSRIREDVTAAEF